LVERIARRHLPYFIQQFPEPGGTFAFWQAEYLQSRHVLGTVMGFGQQKADVYGWQSGHLQRSWLQYRKMYREIIEYTTDFLSGVDAGGIIVEVELKFFAGLYPCCSLD
jgi:hypothetical protein